MYHVNPETNRPNICRSEPGKCSVATRAKHYETAEAAKEAVAKTKPAAKKAVKVEAVAVEVTPVAVEVKEEAPVEEPQKDIIEVLIEDSLRDKTEEELRPKRPAGFFEKLSEDSANLAKKAAQEAEELRDSVVALPKNRKVTETAEKLKSAATEGLSKLETVGKSSFGKLKGAFGKLKK